MKPQLYFFLKKTFLVLPGSPDKPNISNSQCSKVNICRNLSHIGSCKHSKTETVKEATKDNQGWTPDKGKQSYSPAYPTNQSIKSKVFCTRGLSLNCCVTDICVVCRQIRCKCETCHNFCCRIQSRPRN